MAGTFDRWISSRLPLRVLNPKGVEENTGILDAWLTVQLPFPEITLTESGASAVTLGAEDSASGHSAGLISLSVDIPETQYSRPVADLANTNWLRQDDALTDLYTAIDEVTAGDADYVYSAVTGSVHSYTVGLNGVIDPQVSTGHTISLRVGGEGTLTIRLMQDVVEIANWVHVVNGVTDITETLTALQADAVTDYGDLSLVFEVGGA